MTEAGEEYLATLDYAPVQLIPSARQAKDPLNGKIEQMPEFQSFRASLKEAPTEPAATPVAPSTESTPLLDYLQESSRQEKDSGQDTKTKTKSKAGKPEMEKVAILQRTDTKPSTQSAARLPTPTTPSTKAKKSTIPASSSTKAEPQQAKAPATDISSGKKSAKKHKAKKSFTTTPQEPKTESCQPPQILAPPKILTKSNIDTDANAKPNANANANANADASANAHADLPSGTTPLSASGPRPARGRGRGRGRGQPHKAT
ncbi:hypothetical protein MYAM1_003778 [Malassezia yamatoensis]|uniref:Uncharacterized protein n=1 Tax=Malassezia yamatoensis TaxID=253288 RepID=A0AAJ5Z0K8_9BASI|nr:hypothetical protein MYAM1_003778 [Malassezia yamatoensis]